ncbi:MAG: DUF58 domain-containing protein [Candidatus Caldarchaeum sp.]|nr:DUF58 domain-containing protein [Candidatus Caldarchaeum sp.]MDW7978571.1 DUF58 domain-containing protein [Candidatus Caldarchaeum sp.]
MLTREGYALALTSFLLSALTSTIVIYHPLTLSMFAAAVFSFMYILMASRELRSLKPKDFTFTRTVSNQDPKPGERVAVKVVVVNKAGRDLELAVVDGFEGLTLVEGNVVVEKHVKHGEEAELQYVVEADRRGVYSLGPLVVKVSDDFGLCCKYITLEREARLLVRPRLVEKPRLMDSVRRAQALSISGSGFSVKFGADDVFREITEYEEGQPLKNIEWRRTAREDGQIYVRKYDKLNRLRVVFLIDCTVSNMVGKPSLMDTTISSVASTALALLQKGDAVAVKALGAAEPATFYAYNTVDFEGLNTFLTKLKPGLGFDLKKEVEELSWFDAVFLVGRLSSVDGHELRLVENDVRRRKGVLFTIIPVLSDGSEVMRLLNELEMLRIKKVKKQAEFVSVVRHTELPQYLAYLHRMLRAVP